MNDLLRRGGNHPPAGSHRRNDPLYENADTNTHRSHKRRRHDARGRSRAASLKARRVASKATAGTLRSVLSRCRVNAGPSSGNTRSILFANRSTKGRNIATPTAINDVWNAARLVAPGSRPKWLCARPIPHKKSGSRIMAMRPVAKLKETCARAVRLAGTLPPMAAHQLENQSSHHHLSDEKPIPLVIFGRAYWERTLNFDALVEEGTISPEDIDFFYTLSFPFQVIFPRSRRSLTPAILRALYRSWLASPCSFLMFESWSTI